MAEIMGIDDPEILKKARELDEKIEAEKIPNPFEKSELEFRKWLEDNPERAMIIENEEGKYFKLFQLLDKNDIKEIYPAQDFVDNKLWYYVGGEKKIIINSDKEYFSLFELPPGYKPKPGSIPNISGLKYETIKRFFLDKNCLEEDYRQKRFLAFSLFSRIKNYLIRYIFFKNDFHPDLLALWIMGTYVFTVFRYFPYLHIRAEKRSGKTLLMEVMSKIAFNGELVSNISTAVLFRDIQANRLSLFLDEVERMRKVDKEFYGELMRVLNSGFHYLGKVKRVEKIKNDNWTPKSFSTYSPKVFAGINEIDDVLQDRTILIQLWRKKDSEKVERFKLNNSLEAEINQIKQDCYLFALKHAKHIANFVNLEEFEELPDSLSDREKDIFEPVFIMGKIVESEATINNTPINLITRLKEFAIDSSRVRREDDGERNRTSKVVKFLVEAIEEGKVTPEKDCYYDRDTLFHVFMRDYQKDFFPNTNTLKKFSMLINKTLLLKANSYLHVPKKKQFKITRSDLNDLKERYL